MNSVWESIQRELEASSDPLPRRYQEQLFSSTKKVTEVLAQILATQLADQYMDEESLRPMILKQLVEGVIEQDMLAYYHRDYATISLVEVLLLNRGFHAVSAYRVAHELWVAQDYFSAKWINKRTAEVYGVDIHPAARIGTALVLDHCMGIVIGETSILEDRIFLFHHVTLGGTGHGDGKRHPHIESDVVIGAGATVLGDIVIGEGAVIAAGSVVLQGVPAHQMAAGNPAKIKGPARKIQ